MSTTSSECPYLSKTGTSPYACHAHADPGPGRTPRVSVGELTGERRHPEVGYTRQLRRAHQAAVQGKGPRVNALRVRPVVM